MLIELMKQKLCIAIYVPKEGDLGERETLRLYFLETARQTGFADAKMFEVRQVLDIRFSVLDESV